MKPPETEIHRRMQRGESIPAWRAESAPPLPPSAPLATVRFRGQIKLLADGDTVTLANGAELALLAQAAITLTVRAGPRRCRVCGCTDDRACRGGCSWVEADLCSACKP